MKNPFTLQILPVIFAVVRVAGAPSRRLIGPAKRVGPVAGKLTEVTPMFDVLLSRLALHAISIMLGGIGMFCLFMSFTAPAWAASAIVPIVSASAIVYFCDL